MISLARDRDGLVGRSQRHITHLKEVPSCSDGGYDWPAHLRCPLRRSNESHRAYSVGRSLRRERCGLKHRDNALSNTLPEF